MSMSIPWAMSSSPSLSTRTVIFVKYLVNNSEPKPVKYYNSAALQGNSIWNILVKQSSGSHKLSRDIPMLGSTSTPSSG